MNLKSCNGVILRVSLTRLTFVAVGCVGGGDSGLHKRDPLPFKNSFLLLNC